MRSIVWPAGPVPKGTKMRENMNIKKVLYYGTTVILLLYFLLYIPMMNTVGSMYRANSNRVIFTVGEASGKNIMNRISWILLLICTIIKIIVGAYIITLKNKKEINIKMPVLDTIIYITSICIILFITSIYAF